MADGAARAAGAHAPGRLRLSPGRHGLPRAVVAENQRERLLNGVVEAVAEHGYSAATIARIVEAAKISRRTFYEYFEGKEDCFLAAYELIEAHVLDSMLNAPGASRQWPERVRARLAALLDVLSRDAAVSRCFLIEPLAAGGDVAARYREAMQLLAQTLRPEPPPSQLDMEVRDQALMGGIVTLISRRLNAGAADRLPELLPDLVELTLAPFTGREEASRLAAEAA
ncbi:MAG TPA: helix-turn-helix domain-containing protein [Solirubrobacterales bacterium]|jgi:AcrR family transcriptional regulator|nr:helix-turn-helix domain-containing protein [Solirubrobacterales bacterium]